MKRLLALIILVVELGAPLRGQMILNSLEWEQRAKRKFPELALPDSKLSQLFAAEREHMRAINPRFFTYPQWPMLLAQHCSDQLVPAPPEFYGPPLPQNKDVAYSLRPEYERLGVKVRDQGNRGSCVIFGIIGALDFLSAKAGGATELSEQFAGWTNREITHSQTGRTHAYDTDSVIEGLSKYGVCTEELMPYKATAGGVPSKAALSDASQRQHISSSWIHEWKTKGEGFDDQDLEAIGQAIREEHPVSCAVRWPKAGWARFKTPFTMTVKDFPVAPGGHFVVLTGYEKGAQWEGGGRMEFRNSYTSAWAQSGYAWFSFGYLKKYGDDAFVVSCPHLPAKTTTASGTAP